MKHVILAGALAGVLSGAMSPVAAQEAAKSAANRSLGSVTLTRKVLLDGQPIAAGTYQIRLTGTEASLVVGQSPEAAPYVEFLKAGKVVGREVATVVSNADMATMAKWRKPAANTVTVDVLKGDDYLRVWINRGGNNYLIHLRPAA